MEMSPRTEGRKGEEEGRRGRDGREEGKGGEEGRRGREERKGGGKGIGLSLSHDVNIYK